MEIATLLAKKEPEKIYGIMGNMDLTTNHNKYRFITSYKFSNTVKEYLNSPKMNMALKMVMLDSDMENKTIGELSNAELKAINLAKALLENKEYLVFDYFEKGFSDKEKENFKRLFKKLASEYHKTIILFTNDIQFLWDIAEEIIVIEKNQVINLNKEDYIKHLESIDKPPISEMIDLIRAKKIKIDDYKDGKDLLKAIYRIKEKEETK